MDLYTEAQWRGIAAIEHWTDVEHWDECVFERAVIGPAFTGGNFVVRGWFEWLDHRLFGPPRLEYSVFETRGNVRICGECESRLDAIQLARKRISDIGPMYMERLLAQYEEKHQRGLAEEAAKEAIKKAAAAAREAAKASKKVPRRRQSIFDASGGSCHYCGCGIDLRGDWHVEHKMPKALGGSNEPINLVAACGPCNREKKDKTDLEYLALRAARGDTVKS